MAFDTFKIKFCSNPFAALYSSVQWESFSKERQIANLHRRGPNGEVPLMRTTTVYERPSQPFTELHEDVVSKIVSGASSVIKNSSSSISLNNAMAEVYTDAYRTMKAHTDQALDLADDAYICLFSCYENENEPPEYVRVLTITNKTTGVEEERRLDHCSVVMFSRETNGKHVHKIEAGKDWPELAATKKGKNKNKKQQKQQQTDGEATQENGNDKHRWMGLTFRLSKSFVKFDSDGVPYLLNPSNPSTEERKELKLATEEERREFFRYKGLENSTIGYIFPEISYTISPSDRILAG